MIYKSITERASCAAKLAYTSILVIELGLRDIKEINFSLTRFHFLLWIPTRIPGETSSLIPNTSIEYM